MSNVADTLDEVGHTMTFLARGVLAIAFAIVMLLALANRSGLALPVYGAFAVVDGLLAFVANFHARRTWNSPRRSCLVAEGMIECLVGIAVLATPLNIHIVYAAIAANSLIAGMLASVYSYGDQNEWRASWAAIYGITGVILCFAVPLLSAVGVDAVFTGVAVVNLIQGVTRVLLRGGSRVQPG